MDGRLGSMPWLRSALHDFRSARRGEDVGLEPMPWRPWLDVECENGTEYRLGLLPLDPADQTRVIRIWPAWWDVLDGSPRGQLLAPQGSGIAGVVEVAQALALPLRDERTAWVSWAVLNEAVTSMDRPRVSHLLIARWVQAVSGVARTPEVINHRDMLFSVRSIVRSPAFARAIAAPSHEYTLEGHALVPHEGAYKRLEISDLPPRVGDSNKGSVRRPWGP